MFSLLNFISSLFSPALHHVQDRDEKFLSEAVDMCDLENRIRHLDGGHRSIYKSGPYGIFMR